MSAHPNGALLTERLNLIKRHSPDGVVPSRKSLMEIWFLSKSGMEAAVRAMVSRGMIERLGRGHYVIAERYR